MWPCFGVPAQMHKSFEMKLCRNPMLCNFCMLCLCLLSACFFFFLFCLLLIPNKQISNVSKCSATLEGLGKVHQPSLMPLNLNQNTYWGPPHMETSHSPRLVEALSLLGPGDVYVIVVWFRKRKGPFEKPSQTFLGCQMPLRIVSVFCRQFSIPPRWGSVLYVMCLLPW